MTIRKLEKFSGFYWKVKAISFPYPARAVLSATAPKRITVAVGVARGKLNVAIKNYVLEDQSKAESNGVGLKTCKKICESLGMTFDYGITGIKNMKLFTARLEFGIVRKDAEVKVNEDKLS